MAEQGNSTALVPSSPDNYTIKVREFDASGNAQEIAIPVPTSANFREWSIMQQVVMLKKGTWSKSSVAEILFAIAYANSLNLDVMQGDVYSVGDGRIATSNKAKIKMALATGKIKGWTIDTRDTGEKIELAKCIQKTDLECTVVLDVEGLNKPIIRKARLSRWFKATNPNWQGNPEHMLELNTFAHACEYVHPTETGPEEAPPLEPSPIQQSSPAPTKSMIDSLKDEVVADRAAKSSQGEGETTSLEGQLVESLKAVEAKKSAPPVTVEK